jgi:hypothetical protein
MFSYNILCNELNRYHHNFPTCWPMKVVHLTLYYPFPIFSIHNIPDNTLSTPMQFAFRLRTRGNNSPSLFCLLARFLSSAPKQIYKLLTTRNQASRRILFRIVGINTFNPTQKRPTPATGGYPDEIERNIREYLRACFPTARSPTARLVRQSLWRDVTFLGLQC